MNRPNSFFRGSARPIARGFSLIEMLTVISIVAILLAIGVPSFQYVTAANRATSEINGLLGDLQFARAEAMKEGEAVTVCPSSDGATCAGGSTWQNGWIVFSDSNPIGTVNGNDTVLRTQTAFAPVGDTLQSDQNVQTVTFTREGFALNLPNAVTFALHNPSGSAQYTRCLSVTIVGALSTQTAGAYTAENVPCS